MPHTKAMRHANKGLTLLETHLQNKNTANIGYDQQQRILYMATFNAKSVVLIV